MLLTIRVRIVSGLSFILCTFNFGWNGNGSHCLSVALEDGQIMVRVMADRQKDLLPSVSNLNDGFWHHVRPFVEINVPKL